MGEYIYRLAKRSEAVEVARFGTVGMLVYAYKPWRTWSGEKIFSDARFEAIAENAANRSWGGAWPKFATVNPTADDVTPDAIEMIGSPVIHWREGQSTIGDYSRQWAEVIGHLVLRRGVFEVATLSEAEEQRRQLCEEMGHVDGGRTKTGRGPWYRKCERCHGIICLDEEANRAERELAKRLAEKERVRNLSPLEYAIEFGWKGVQA